MVLDRVANDGGMVAESVAVHFGVDLGGAHRRVHGLDVQADGVELAFHPIDLRLRHGRPRLGEIDHGLGIGLEFLGAGEAEL